VILIALHGDPGSGKDSIGDYLVREHGFVRLAFADRLKQMCEALDPVVTYEVDRQTIAEFADYTDLNFEEMKLSVPTLRPVRLLEAVGRYGWDEAKRKYPEVRRTQQRLATEVVRDMIDPMYWVDYIEKQFETSASIVITDLRFPNEARLVTSWIGEIWWVTRKDNPYPSLGANAAHVSEQWHPEKFVPIANDGDLEDLYVQVEMILTGAEIDV